MVRITQIKKSENTKKYKKAILQLFLSEGHEALTYAKVAKKTGVSITTLQGYFPTINEIRTSLHEHIIFIIMESLDFSDPLTFFDSWEKALTEKPFRHSIKLVCFYASQQRSHNDLNLRIKEELHRAIEDKFWANSCQFIDMVMVYSLLQLFYNTTPEVAGCDLR